MRTADDIITRAETDGRGVALIPLSETGREIGFETPGAARVRLKQMKPKPYAVQRSDALPGLTRFYRRKRRRRDGMARRRRRHGRRLRLRRRARPRGRDARR